MYKSPTPPLERKRISIILNDHHIGVSILSTKRGGQWIVALHGIQSNGALFEPLFRQPFTHAYSILAIDFVGFGDSDKPDTFSYSVEDQAKIVQEVLDRLGIDEMHLVGHSLGGMVGTLLLPVLGGRVLTFANLEGNLVAADCGASKDVAKVSLEEFESTGYDQMRARIADSDESSAASRSHWLKAIPASVFYKTSVSIVEWSTSEKLRVVFNQSDVRRLYVYGSNNAAKAKSVPDTVHKVEIPGAGHFMLLDQPQVCSQVLQEFISTH